MADDCGVGLEEVKIFSGATIVCDFCAHSHKDTDNLVGGCTVILTLTKPDNRGLNSQPEDEQIHGNQKHTIFPCDVLKFLLLATLPKKKRNIR